MARLSGKKGGWALVVAVVLMCLVGCGGNSGGSGSNSGSSSRGGSGGTGISNTVTSPSDMQVGDLMAVDFGSSTSESLDFSGVASGAKFILAIGSYNNSGSGTSMQLSTDISNVTARQFSAYVEPEVEGAGSEGDGYASQEVFDAWLRASEDALPYSENSYSAAIYKNSVVKSASIKAVSLGQTETFRVLSSLSSTSSYVEVTGEVRCSKDNVAFYVDTSVSDDILSDADISVLCNEFDGVAATEQSLFGSMSDVDGDGKLHVLMTKQINKLGALGGGIITGYFYAGDLYERSSSNQVSNHREVIYTMVPDPDGVWGTDISNEFAMSNLLPAVLPHELQHAISYNQHVFVNAGLPEENWLNEGLSHLAEDVLGYGMENPSRYSLYLSSPSTYGLVTLGSPNLMERGASFLFLRFLYEQSDSSSAFLTAMLNTSLQGVDNLENAFNGQSESFDEFSEFMSRWTVALIMTNMGISSDSRYVYRDRTQNGTTGNWEGVCLICDADDNRGTALDGVHLNQYMGFHNSSIDAAAAKFYNITSIPDEIQMDGTDGGGNFGILVRYE